VLSSVTASVIGRAEFGNSPFLHLPAFDVQHPVEYLLFAVLGLLAGLVGVAFTRVLYWVEDGCDWSWAKVRGPEWVRPAVGGVLLGLLLLVLPQMYGVGYPVLSHGVAGRYALWFVLVLLAGKMLATSLTIGIGGSGGVFAPSLFIGGMFGALYGGLIGHLLPHTAGPIGAYGLIGMGAVFAGAARAPITAVVIMFELTGEYSIILPLMAAIVLATGVSNLASRDTIYTLKLRRRGIDLHSRPNAGVLDTLTVRDAMQPISVTVTGQTPLPDVAQTLEQEPLGQIAVIDEAGRYHGVLTARAVADTLSAEQRETSRAGSIAEHVPSIRADRSLNAALDLLDTTVSPAVPVLDPTGCAVVGWLTHQHVLAAIRRRENGRRP
jgi:CIC family chloride channel protein